MAWNTNTIEFAAAVAEFEQRLPGFWWSVGQCSVGAHASCAVDGHGDQRHLLDHVAAGETMAITLRKPLRPMTVRDAAIAFRTMLLERDIKCGEIDFSTNRHGENSAYFHAAAEGCNTRVRVSDHDANPDFRGYETHVFFEMVTQERAAALAQEIIEFGRSFIAKNHRKEAERAAYEAPFIERFLAAKQHEQHAIVCEAYPHAKGDPHLRAAIRARWMKRSDPEQTVCPAPSASNPM